MIKWASPANGLGWNEFNELVDMDCVWMNSNWSYVIYGLEWIGVGWNEFFMQNSMIIYIYVGFEQTGP